MLTVGSIIKLERLPSLGILAVTVFIDKSRAYSKVYVNDSVDIVT